MFDEQEKKVYLFNPVEILQEQINDSNRTGFIKKSIGSVCEPNHPDSRRGDHQNGTSVLV
ncbi:MAG: hypothetical protein JJU37_00115 [Balneolaceae bacterium]|nr:hypothetical protein [Balneolaceae bacterium]